MDFTHNNFRGHTVFQTSSSKQCTHYSDSSNWAWKLWIPSGWWKKYSKGSDVHFNAGDLIDCNIPDSTYYVFTPKHHLLATSSTTVAHSWGSGDTSFILEEDWTDGRNGLRSFFCDEICWVKPKYYVDGKSDAIERARNDVERFKGKSTYYDLFTCNCEHWVQYWVYGVALSQQSGLPTGYKCKI